MEITETPQQRRARLGYAGCQAEDAARYVELLGEKCGFSPEAIIERSGFASWLDCSEKWGYTGDAMGYWKSAVGDAAHSLKRKRNFADTQRKREENAHKHGGEICDRCGGAGGLSSWPGFVCYDCGGRGWILAPMAVR